MVFQWCAITASIRTRLAVSGQNGSGQRSGTARHRPNRIVRPTSTQWRREDLGIDPLTDCGGRDERWSPSSKTAASSRLLWHLDLLAELSRGPPSDDFVYQPFYDDLPVVERRTSSTSRSGRSKSLRRPTPVASEPMSPQKAQRASAPA
jgi:hypothetical protein